MNPIKENILEKTEVIYGRENTIKRTLEDFSRVRKKLDCCVDSVGATVNTSTKPVKRAFLDLKKRGIKIRFITEITANNIKYCRELIEIADEVRHLDGIKGNFALTEFSYAGVATLQEAQPLPTQIISTVRAFVEQQQFFFDMLWNKSIPAVQRINEIEYGIEREINETLQNSTDILRLFCRLIESAKKEILWITSNLHNEYASSNIDLLKSMRKIAPSQKHFKLNVLLDPHSNGLRNQNEFLKLLKDCKINYEIRFLEKELQSHVSILIIDHKFMLSSALRSDSTLKKNNYNTSKSIATYTNNEPTVLSYVNIFEALWKQSELYQLIKESNVRLQQFNEAQKEFIDTAAHELRNPILPILNLSISLQEEQYFVKDKQIAEMLEIIVRNAKKLQKLTEELLDIAKIENQLLDLHLEHYNIVEQVNEIVSDFKSQQPIGGKNNRQSSTIHFIVGNHRLKNLILYADKTRIGQVIVNLLSNAVKFIGHKKPKEISIRIDIVNKKDLIVKITNTGNGIDPKVMPKLFKKFGKSSNTGTGLGLFISKGIIEAHNGRIWAKNEVDGLGASFTFSIPLKDPGK
jgi:nitrogen-specific signal transduction histidine kinase